jgi:hypothetical protein
LKDAIKAVAGTASIIETGPAVARELQRRLPRPYDSAVPADTDLLQFDSSGDRDQFATLAATLLAVTEGRRSQRS